MSSAAVLPTARAGEASGRIGVRLLLALMAGRATFRLVLYAANVALLAGWGHQTYARYAAASGALVWLLALAQAGPEKTALKLLPHAGEARAAILGGLLAIVRGVPLAALVIAAGAIAIDTDAAATLYVAAAAQFIAVGLNVAAVAIQRGLGRTGRDIVNFALLSAAWVIVTASAVALDAQPALYLFCLCLAAVGVSEVTMRGLPAPARRGLGGRGALRGLGRTIALMGVSDLAGVAACSTVFLVLPLTAAAGQTGALYLAFAGWWMLLGLCVYAVRVFTPRISLWLAAGGRLAGARRARLMACWALGLNLAWLAVMAVLIGAGEFTSLSAGLAGAAVLTALLVSRAPVALLMLLSMALLENGDARSLRTVAAGSAGGAVVVVAASLAVIPFFGAAGAIWALAADDLVLAVVVLVRHRAGAGGRSLSRRAPAYRGSRSARRRRSRNRPTGR